VIPNPLVLLQPTLDKPVSTYNTTNNVEFDLETEEEEEEEMEPLNAFDVIMSSKNRK